MSRAAVKFFDNVQHDVLMAREGRKVRDRGLLALIARYLRAGVLVGERIEPTVIGTPQGGPLSPLLANILLDDLDKELERRGHRFVRYADDLLILVKSHRAGERVMARVTRFLTRRLRLVVNEHKSRVVKTHDCVFLGFTFRGTKLRWSERAYQDFRHQVRTLTGLSSKGYWRLSRTLATQIGMTDDWLKRQGLISVRDLWMRAHGYT